MNANMKTLRCNCCGNELPSDTIKFVVEVRCFADFDGYLEEFEGDIEDGVNSLLDNIDEMEEDGFDAEEATRDAIYILCKKCRDNFLSDPFQIGSMAFDAENRKGTLH
jgi:hypothetical protein